VSHKYPIQENLLGYLIETFMEASPPPEHTTRLRWSGRRLARCLTDNCYPVSGTSVNNWISGTDRPEQEVLDRIAECLRLNEPDRLMLHAAYFHDHIFPELLYYADVVRGK